VAFVGKCHDLAGDIDTASLLGLDQRVPASSGDRASPRRQAQRVSALAGRKPSACASDASQEGATSVRRRLTWSILKQAQRQVGAKKASERQQPSSSDSAL